VLISVVYDRESLYILVGYFYTHNFEHWFNICLDIPWKVGLIRHICS